MAVFTIRYDGLSDSIKRADSTARSLGNLRSDLQDISSRIGSLSGSDSAGYANTAANLVRRKMQSAKSEQERWQKLSRELKSLKQKAEETDRKVANDIRYSGSTVIGNRTLFQIAGDAIFGAYVSVVSKLSRLKGVGDLISSFAKRLRIGWERVSNRLTEVKNYFKYGDGKYLWNIAKTVLAVVGAIAGLVTAAAGVLAASPVLVAIGFLGLVCSVVVTVTKLVDSQYSIDSNTKAYGLATQYRSEFNKRDNWWEAGEGAEKGERGSLTAARYYGEIEGYKDYVEKTDYGGIAENDAAMVRATVFNVTQKVAEIGATVCTLIVAVGNAQYVKDADGNWFKGENGKTISKNQLRELRGQEKQSTFSNYIAQKGEDIGMEYARQKRSSKYAPKGAYKLDKNGNLVQEGYDYSKVFKYKGMKGYDSKLPDELMGLNGRYAALVNDGDTGGAR